jgi:hypothetical protein
LVIENIQKKAKKQIFTYRFAKKESISTCEGVQIHYFAFSSIENIQGNDS